MTHILVTLLRVLLPFIFFVDCLVLKARDVCGSKTIANVANELLLSVDIAQKERVICEYTASEASPAIRCSLIAGGRGVDGFAADLS
jgi:hypothetical protein